MDFLVSNCNRDFANRNGMDQTPLFVMGTLFGIVNGTCRFFWGYLLDKYGFKLLMTIITFIEITVGTCLYFMVKIYPVYIILVLFAASCIGGNFCILTPVFNQIFGLEMGPEVYAVTSIAIGTANICGPLIVNLFLKENSDFLYAFLLGATLSVIKLCVLVFFDDDEKFIPSTKLLPEEKNEK